MSHFIDELRAFVDARKDLFSEKEQALMTHKELLPLSTALSSDEYAQMNRELLSGLLNLYATKLGEKQAGANERHAKAMKWLTIALFVAAALEAVGTAVAALIQLGVFTRGG